MSVSKKSQPLERHQVTIHYLEQRQPVVLPPLPRPARRLAIMKAEKPPLGFYRYLFNTIGEPHRWITRRYLSDDDLRAVIHRDDVHIHILYADGSPAGLGEIDDRKAGQASIKFFGLIPEAQGQGLGRWFFREVTAAAWSLRRGRVTIETCSLDSPRALQLYQREGFTLHDHAAGVVEWHG